jgi:SAM-dependent methyltransferase
VRNQYEAHPYPVWSGLHRVGADTVEALATRLRPDRPAASRMSPARILVAGCGTGEQSVQTARMYPQSEILAVDLSVASLAYAARMTEKYGIASVTYRQADILELTRLDERFALVECTGVLHHLRDPLAGWRVLVGLLEPDGLMRIALYSERARRILDAATDYLRSLQLPPTAHGTRRGRQAITALPDGHPAKAAMAFGDFYSLNGCRDLLMHAQEHRFTLPRIAECLSILGLRFLGMQCSGETQRRFLEMFGDRQAAGDLLAWNRFEEAYPATFAGMYSFWCCRDSADSG